MLGYKVRRMTRDELDGAVERAAREGWNPGLHDASCFWAIDPDGFFAGELDGRVVACGAALRYDDRFAFCGLYVVDPAYRGRGLGLELTRARLAHVGGCNAGLDGVLGMAGRYERLGYRRAHLSTRFTFTPRQAFPEPDWLVPPSAVDFGKLADYDAAHFPARREGFLRAWLGQPDSRALVLRDGSTVKGYGVIRRCRQGHKVGPLFANDEEGAGALLGALCNHGLGGPVSLDVPEPNAAGVALARRLGMEPAFACVRMYLRGDPGLPLGRVFGLTTFEAG
jgi:hypothetical protein